MFIIYYVFDNHSCPEDRSSARINMKHSEVPEIPPEYFPEASGRSWTVAFTAVRLCSQPWWSRCTSPSSPSTHCSRPFLPVCRWAQVMLSTFLQLDGALQLALSWSAGVWDRLGMQTAFASLSLSIEGKARLYRCTRKMLVTCLFFSPNKLIDYFLALCSGWMSLRSLPWRRSGSLNRG